MIAFFKEIVAHKKNEIEILRKKRSVEELMNTKYFHKPKRSLKYAVKNNENGIISEFKRKTPFNTAFKTKFSIEEMLLKCKEQNVAGISIATDEKFYGGSVSDLRLARKYEIPVLRNDFIIDPYQLFESKANGADAVMLIANFLEKHEMIDLMEMAHDMRLEVFLEFHERENALKLPKKIDGILINVDRLKTGIKDFKQAALIKDQLPKDTLTIIAKTASTIKDFELFKKNHFDGVLLEETFLEIQE